MTVRKETLNEVTPHVKLPAAERPANARLRIADLLETDVAAGIHAVSYFYARRVSAGNASFMHTFMQQVPAPKHHKKRANATNTRQGATSGTAG